MEIVFNKEEKEKIILLDEYQTLLDRHYPDILHWTHYDLSERSDVDDPEAWKRFILDNRVQAWLDEELKMHIKSQVFKMVNSADAVRNTAVVQTLNSFLNYLEKREIDPSNTGPAFVYSFVPLTEAEQQAENVRILKSNPFKEAMM